MTLNTPSFRKARRSARLLTGLGMLALGGLLTAPVSAQVVMNGPTLYRGETAAASGIKLSGWGSGAVTEENKGVFGTGTRSLRLVTHGLYQGASLQLASPVDIGAYVDNKYAYLSFVVVPPAAPGPAAAGGGAPGGPYGGKGGGLASPGGYSSESGGGPQSGGNPGSYGGRNEAGGLNSKSLAVKYQPPHAMQNLRVVLVTSSGRQLEMLLPLDSAVDDGPWKRVSIPVSLIPGLKADDAKIKEVRLFGDTPGVMRVGNIGVMVDETPITVDALPNRDLARLATHEFRIATRAGITPLAVSWDWDGSDGVQAETEGRAVTHQFRKESVYDRNSNKILDNVVTVTVRDVYGIKKPVSLKFSVHVTP
jgi:hypothetical protein